MSKTKLIVLVLAAVVLLAGFQARQLVWVSSAVGMMVVPASSTAVPNVGGVTVELDWGFFTNVTSSAATLTITDGTTNCNGAACQVIPVISIPGNSGQSIDFRSVPVTGGVFWQAGTANAIQGYIRGRK